MAAARPETPIREDEPGAGLTEELIQEVDAALAEGANEHAAGLARKLHVADQADLLEQLTAERRQALVDQLRPLEPVLLTWLDETLREEVIDQIGADEAAAAIAELETDDAIDVLQDLDEAAQIHVLATLDAADRVAVKEGLGFPEDSAGRLMQRDLVAVPEFWTVGQTIDYLRNKRDLPDEFYDIFIVNPRFQPVGAIPLSRVLRSRRGVLLTELRLKEMYRIPAALDQEEVAFRFRQYGLVSAPVVNDAGRLLGMITVDDVVHVIEEEAEEDIMRLGGVSETDLFQPPLKTGMARFPWLLVNLGTAVLASLVIALFDDVIDQVVALAVLMPIVASMGGNGGTQTVTVVVRGLAMHEITPANATRILTKEFLVGSLNGIVFLVIGVALATIWYGDPMLGVLFGLALLLALVFGTLAGVLIPLLIDRLGLDPAVSSGVFLTTVTDVVAFFSFLGLAALYLL
jgi:magnesium transporter